MRNEFDLIAFIDENGSLGWGIKLLDGTFEAGRLDACYDANLLAHDILEHNHESTLAGIANELQAIGAAEYVRQEQLNLAYDIEEMAHRIPHSPIAEPEDLNKCNGFQGFVEEGARLASTSLYLNELTTEERKNLSNYYRYASTYMDAGYDWARDYYEGTCAYSIRQEIMQAFISAEHEGEQAKIIIDFDNRSVLWLDQYDLYEEEEAA